VTKARQDSLGKLLNKRTLIIRPADGRRTSTI
jgi:hypothetical protein